ncbi:MAG TPA: poly-gamma-glutamate biosynthesis protein PgsC [Calditrichaeota bacterium]|nr:poly-gamma-glutamate biosynthesis protein PgsC [Calditrichota bacterium]
MIVTSFGLGIAIGFIFFEISGLTAGGIIVPGYLALFVQEPLRIVLTLLISLLVYLLTQGLSRYVILFGRRRFFLIIIMGFLIRTEVDYLSVYIVESSVELQAIGYIIPGLIANEFYRQGVLKTVLAIVIVVTLVYLILSLLTGYLV